MKLSPYSTMSNEAEIQDLFEEWINKRAEELAYIDCKATFAREVHLPEIGRRSDFLGFWDGALVNVEAKCHDMGGVIRQMKDHALGVDYCFALIPDYTMTPKHFKRALVNNGFGLLVYNHKAKTITEALEAHFNRPKRDLREKIAARARAALIKPKQIALEL